MCSWYETLMPCHKGEAVDEAQASWEGRSTNSRVDTMPTKYYSRLDQGIRCSKESILTNE